MADVKTAVSEASLYEQDFFAWTQEQAAALRSVATGGNARLDYENLIEEVESLGIALKHELSSRIATIIEHLAKLQYSPAALPRIGWRATVRRERAEIDSLLEQSPSLRKYIPHAISQEALRTLPRVIEDLRDRGELTQVSEDLLSAAPGRYDETNVLGDWFPEPET